ncbi:MAG: alpha/beta fold hydrolase [Gammaproteobacteria bacterium]
MSKYRKLKIGSSSVEMLELHGDPGLPALVLLHEGLGCVELWRDFPLKLNQKTGRSVVAYSRRGYGGSDSVDLPRPIDHMQREAREFLPPLLDKLGKNKPILVGHSDGATIALEFAAAFPGDLSALILFAPHVFVEDFALAAIRAIDERFHDGGLKEKLRRYHGLNVETAFRGWCDTWLHPQFKKWSMEHLLEHIAVPILQFQGLSDEYGSPAHVRSIEQHVRADVDTVLLENCGHAPQFEAADHALSAICAFLRQHCPAAAK